MHAQGSGTRTGAALGSGHHPTFSQPMEAWRFVPQSIKLLSGLLSWASRDTSWFRALALKQGRLREMQSFRGGGMQGAMAKIMEIEGKGSQAEG